MLKETLDCSVINCKYNDSHLCTASFIRISGSSAAKPNETCCSSFIEKNGMSSFCESNLKEDFTETNNINCDAIKCTYNYNLLCNAPHVHIDAPNVCCDTFKQK